MMKKQLSSKKYISFFRLRFAVGLQYRSAALAGIFTQFMWGAMEILIFNAFYTTDPKAFPMTLSATVSYIWLQQAFLAFFSTWQFEEEIFDTITNGNIAYELARPIDIYQVWLSRSVALRMAKGFLRCFPLLFFAVLLPAPYGIAAPESILSFVLFLITLALGLFVTVAYTTLIYVLTMFLISPQGLRILAVSVTELCSGAIIPLPFFPDNIRRVMETLPFASMQNVPLRVYSGDLAGTELLFALSMQLFWLTMLLVIGKVLCNKALKQIAVQGG